MTETVQVEKEKQETVVIAKPEKKRGAFAGFKADLRVGLEGLTLQIPIKG